MHLLLPIHRTKLRSRLELFAVSHFYLKKRGENYRKARGAVSVHVVEEYMRLFTRFVALSVLTLGSATGFAATKTLVDADRHLLSSYEAIRAALAADNLEGARATASGLSENANAVVIARADSLNTARMAFKKLSAEAIAIGANLPGFVVVHCPMAEADWLQTSRGISNPYLGKKMPTCGKVKSSS